MEKEGVDDDDENDEDDDEDDQGDDEDDEDDPNAEKDDLQVAWEALETAKVLFGRDPDANAAALAGRWCCTQQTQQTLSDTHPPPTIDNTTLPHHPQNRHSHALG